MVTERCGELGSAFSKTSDGVRGEILPARPPGAVLLASNQPQLMQQPRAAVKPTRTSVLVPCPAPSHTKIQLSTRFVLLSATTVVRVPQITHGHQAASSKDKPRTQSILASRVCPTCRAARLPLKEDSQLAGRVRVESSPNARSVGSTFHLLSPIS